MRINKNQTLGVVLCSIIILMGTGCTENQRARQFGGTAKIQVTRCHKLTVATWKADSLWLLTKPAKSGDRAETYMFKEDSSFGILQGTVTISEQIDDSCFK